MMSKSSSNVWVQDKDFSAIQYIGQRELQEDFCQFRLLPDGGLLAILSDGMGGHTSGEVASNAAVNAFDKSFMSYSGSSISSKLGASLTSANTELARLIDANSRLHGMGCTLIGAYINPNGIYWVSVGDSLLYLFRAGKLKQINEDHSMAPLIQESLRAGKITQQEAEAYPNKNALRSALMGSEIPLIDSPEAPLKLYAGDVLVIASDGLLTLSEKEILSVINKNYSMGAEIISNNLIKFVKEKNVKNQDNITVQVIKISAEATNRSSVRSKILASILGLISLIAISSFLILTPGVKSWLTFQFGASRAEVSEIKPVALQIDDIKKNEQGPIDKNSRPGGLGGSLDLDKDKSKNPDKSKSDTKKSDRKNLDEKSKKDLPESKADEKSAGNEKVTPPAIDLDKDKKVNPDSSKKDEIEKT
jgi:serine/threonine protein phosphatase PrpC